MRPFDGDDEELDRNLLDSPELFDTDEDLLLGDDEDFEDEDCLDDEPDIGFQFEHDSAMASAGFGTDEDYGYFGDNEDAFDNDFDDMGGEG